MDVAEEVRQIVQPEKKVRLTFGTLSDDPSTEVWHIRAVVDDKQVVYRVWQGKRWVYQMQSLYYCHLMWRDGHLAAA
jgi:hypothetical protein